jgi:hypothetical protein
MIAMPHMSSKTHLKPRILTADEKRTIASEALAVFRRLHPESAIKIVVEDMTDGRGVPRYSIQVNPRPERKQTRFSRRSGAEGLSN